MLKILLFIFLATVSLPAVTVENAGDNPPGDQEKQEKESPERAQLNRLIKESLGLAVKTLSENEGGIYPYGMTMNQDGKVSLKGYSGKREEAPPQEKWIKGLTQSFRKTTDSNSQIVAASITRLHQTENDQGETVPGIWVLADHRNNQPWVAFFPLVKKDNGKREVGDPAYQATDQWLFSEQSEGETTSSGDSGN